MYGSITKFVAALLLLAAAVTRAEVVEDLYSARVPVENQGSEALARGAGAALAEVIVKVSGSPEVLEAPDIAAALENARAQVQQYAFVRGEGADEELSARFEFSRAYVTHLLTRSGMPVWTANRPRVLVWMAAESGGDRRFVTRDEMPELASELLQAFQRRGVPVQLPLYDLGDATAVGLEDVWAQRTAPVQAASARYGVEDVLIGRAVEVSNGNWVGDWAYLHGIDRSDRSTDAPSAEAFVAAGAGLVADAMASRYAVAPARSGEGLVRLTVSGVEGFADYAAIVTWLESLELVEQANVASIQGDRMEFDLAAAADAPRLAKIIQLNDRLVPLDPAGLHLDYQWRR